MSNCQPSKLLLFSQLHVTIVHNNNLNLQHKYDFIMLKTWRMSKIIDQTNEYRTLEIKKVYRQNINGIAKQLWNSQPEVIKLQPGQVFLSTCIALIAASIPRPLNQNNGEHYWRWKIHVQTEGSSQCSIYGNAWIFYSYFRHFAIHHRILGNTLVLIVLHKVTSIYPPTKLFFRYLAVPNLCVALLGRSLYAIEIPLSRDRGERERFVLHVRSFSSLELD